MTTINVDSDYSVAPGQTLTFTNEWGFAVDQSGMWPTPAPLHLIIAGTVVANSTGADSIFGVVDKWSTAGSTIEIAAGGSLSVNAQANGAHVEGIDASGPALTVVNHGTIEVSAPGSADGLYSQGIVDFQNTGRITVTSADIGASGVAFGGGHFNNSGVIEVDSNKYSVGVSVSGFGGVSDFVNSGEIRVHVSDPAIVSVGVAWSAPFQGGGAGFINDGIIEGAYALKVGAPPGGATGDPMLFVNDGHMYGAVDMGPGDAILVNGGEIVGAVNLGLGDDTYSGGSGVVWGSVDGGDGNDVIWGGAQGESLTGGNGADTIHGGGGDDLISGGRDSDLLDGGPGNDGVTYEDATMGVNLDFVSGRADSSGEDTISGFELAFGSRFADTLSGDAGANTLSGDAGADQIFGREGNDSIVGGDGQDYLRGGDGADSLSGGADFDDINGNAGNDTASGGDGNDWVVGGKDDDRLSGDAGDDIVYGNLGNDTCDGGTGNDLIRGGQGDDVLIGGPGDDWLSGDRGADTLTGGAGADIFHSSSDAGLDVVTDFNSAEGDRVMLDPGSAYTTYQSGADTVIDFGGGNELVLKDVQLAGLPAGWILGA
ncbi:calcium-binding protein [Phenylobacterium sp.]|uniref:calcium-binding protein n=1 Tax=Phenylobacterium sp. TaxID=1871053 RepID=UPI002DE79ACD|nr:calcium-binding protein [Phenylobacterium sp.]